MHHDVFSGVDIDKALNSNAFWNRFGHMAFWSLLVCFIYFAIFFVISIYGFHIDIWYGLKGFDSTGEYSFSNYELGHSTWSFASLTWMAHQSVGNRIGIWLFPLMCTKKQLVIKSDVS